jgi:hypothetical protein
MRAFSPRQGRLMRTLLGHLIAACLRAAGYEVARAGLIATELPFVVIQEGETHAAPR